MAKAKAPTTPKVSNYGKNKIAKILKHLKSHPDDEQSQQALSSLSVNSQPTRKASKAKLGWLSNAVGSQIISRFNGQPTKQAAFAFARAFRFMKVRPFMISPVFVGGPDNTVLLKMKHTSKLSNFKGAVKTAA